MDLWDGHQTAETLFKLVNVVVQRMISEPKEVQEIYDGLPKSAREKRRVRSGLGEFSRPSRRLAKGEARVRFGFPSAGKARAAATA